MADTGDRPGGRATVRRVMGAGPGPLPVPIASLAERPVLEPNATRLILGARELRANLFWPSWHRPGSGVLPVLLDPYGGAVTALQCTPASSVSRARPPAGP